MPLGLLGRKIGMTQVYADDGKLVGVTAIEAGPCFVLAVKEKSVQMGFDPLKKVGRMKKPLAGYFKKLNISPCNIIREIPKDPAREYKPGEEIKADLFKPGDFVDVTGTSIGKGFQGGMKRWNWQGGPMTHGSTSHRRIGSLGSSTTPGRVFKGHHLPGHMGAVRVTVQNLQVVRVDNANNLLLVDGAIPGHKNGYVIVRQAKKRKAKITVAPVPEKKAAAKKK
jgi:large subunit ribosomal protein L3